MRGKPVRGLVPILMWIRPDPSAFFLFCLKQAVCECLDGCAYDVSSTERPTQPDSVREYPDCRQPQTPCTSQVPEGSATLAAAPHCPPHGYSVPATH
ncbi:uncharacterized protein QC761_118424 [Podospora bellae-mahoneyi]|uniref:Secreted protein n=1 Tax=Podospora bellae-mahoneyi TaxID=2093777 RepID=A0ABR0G0Z9_9PEZI|nr:hypothetical protein QC761_118424 [Podospora bellae-mahoneyi]